MKKYFPILLIFLLFGCHPNNKKNKTANVIPKQEMIKILVDVELAEAAISYKQGKNGPPEFYANYYYKAVFQKHHITKQQFDESLNYYAQKNDELSDIFTQVTNNLSLTQSETANK